MDDWTQGVPLGYVRELADYWANEYDWRAREDALNQFDQFTTEIDDLDIHFIHQRSPHADAFPLVLTHGWPGSIAEFHKRSPGRRHGCASEHAARATRRPLCRDPPQPAARPTDLTGTLQQLLQESAEDRNLFLGSHFAAEMRHLEPLPAKMAHYLYAPVDPQHLAELDAIAFVGRGSRAPRSG